ncbi:hypothetical protein EVAR_95305_1 [Eumeta japonica]|uniref:Circadian clock-controlled protein n=1 Tax=Eumeta variegata TaxID=151549 RepID=A0A4C1U938_EUMVA|nr:hypothetical protein EVAR_95305_1 [Eumeta japonica]
MRKLPDIQTARLVYFGCFHNLMSYRILPCGHAADIDRIFVLQMQAVRAIYRLGCRVFNIIKFKELEFLTPVSQFSISFFQKMKKSIIFGLALLVYANASPYKEMIPLDDNVRSMFDVSHVEFKRTWAEQSISPSVSEFQDGQRSLVADRIKEFLENYRDAVEHGSDNHPPLDPLEIDQFGPYSFQTDSIPSIRATVNARDVTVAGLKWYVVDEVTFNLLRLGIGFHLTVPRLTITGDYDAQARVALFITHSAAGAFRFFINRFEVDGDMRLGVSTSEGGHLVLRELNLQVDIHDTSVYIEGLVESGLINFVLNWVLQNVSQDVIQSHRDDISQILTDMVFDIVNDVLKDFTLNDLIN